MSPDHAPGFVEQLPPTRDAFLGGRVIVSQPARGFRAGLDSVLLGAGVDPGTRALLELGCGAGTAACCALATAGEAGALLADRDPEMVALATENLAANGFSSRARAVVADVTAPGAERVAAGIAADRFTTVIANPPFFARGRGTAPADPAAAAARQMAAADLGRWVRTAAAAAAPRGEVVFVHLAAALPALLAAFAPRFGALAIRPVAPRPGMAATRVLVRGIKGSRAPPTLLPPLVLHAEAGEHFAPEAEAVLRGRAALHWHPGPIAPK